MIKNISLTLVSTLIALLAVEIILRLFLGNILYTGNKFRTLYYSSPTLQVVKNGNNAVHYTPNIPIRSITVYYNKVEYDTRHHTNNMGFISNKDYHKEDKDGVLFLGDSFTAGVGSSKPWLPMLNEKYPDINLYSFGVTGTGQKNFYKLFENYQDDLNYSTVVIMSISDDLTRPLWYPLKVKNSLYFCRESTTKKQCTTHVLFKIPLIDYNINENSLLLPEELYLKKAYKVFKSKYITYKELNKKQEEKVKKLSVKAKKSPHKPTIGLEYIAKIKELADKKGKRVIFVHIPEKEETMSGKYRYNVGERIKALDIEYISVLKDYKFDKNMYYTHDGHPNDKGYAYISSIIEDIMKLAR